MNECRSVGTARCRVALEEEEEEEEGLVSVVGYTDKIGRTQTSEVDRETGPNWFQFTGVLIDDNALYVDRRRMYRVGVSCTHENGRDRIPTTL